MRGFTLVELVATIVILSIALAAVAGVVSFGIANSSDSSLEVRAIALGESYLDEIMGRRFDERSAASGLGPCYGLPPGGDTCTAVLDLGSDGGETTRQEYDDVDDYNGLVEGFGASPIQDAEGVDRAQYANFHVAVTVAYAGADIVLVPPVALDETNAKLITVTVTTRDQNDSWEFSVYKGNY